MITQSTDEVASGRRWENLFFLAVILAVTVIAYGPLLGGVWDLGARTTQALNAFVLLGLAFLDALWAVIKAQPFRPVINLHGLFLFGLSCMSLAVASVTGIWPLAVLGLCLDVGALLSFSFGRQGVKSFYPALVGFGVSVALLVVVPQADESLRLFAGTVSAKVLPVLGIRADMLIQQDPFQVMLVAERGAGVFNVATECNGFGILLSSVVLSLILALRRRVPLYGVAVLVGISAVIGLVFNVTRIVVIALTSLQTDVPYNVIHEGFGSLVYVLALVVVFALNLLISRYFPARQSR